MRIHNKLRCDSEDRFASHSVYDGQNDMRRLDSVRANASGQR